MVSCQEGAVRRIDKERAHSQTVQTSTRPSPTPGLEGRGKRIQARVRKSPNQISPSRNLPKGESILNLLTMLLEQR